MGVRSAVGDVATEAGQGRLSRRPWRLRSRAPVWVTVNDPDPVPVRQVAERLVFDST